MAKVFYVGSLLGGLLATFLLIDALLSRGSGGGQATAAIAVVLVPYLMGRAWAGVAEPGRPRGGEKA